MGRFTDARRDGTYKPGNLGNNGIPVIPAQAVPGVSGFGGGLGRSGVPAQLYDAFGRPLDMTAFRSPIDGGPGVPIAPQFPEPDRQPRELQGQPAFNLTPIPRTDEPGLTFDQLRALAAACPYLMIAIAHRKKQIRGIRWKVSPLEGKTQSARDAHAKPIEAVTAFLRKPNRLDNLRFGEWVVQLMEEILTTDAGVFWKHPTLDGNELHSLVQIDGATIKPIVDEFFRVVGYQQVLYGLPRSQYRTAPVADGVVRRPEELAGRIIYLTSNPTVNSVYGRTVTEEIQPIVEIAIMRAQKQLAFYTDGTLPEGFLTAPESPLWESPDVIQKAQRFYDEEGMGTTTRSKLTWLPGGTKYVPTKPFNYSREEEEAIISAICAGYGVPRSIFVAQVNRATAEVDRNQSADVGFQPLLQFLKDFLDDVIQNDLAKQIPGADELEVDFDADRAGNEKETAEALTLYVGSGILTVDEARAEKGLDPAPEEEEPEPMPAAAGVPGAPVPGVPAKPGEAKPPAPGEEQETPAEGEAPPEKKAPPKENAEAVKAEIAAWERFARKRVAKRRQADPFRAAHVPRPLVDAIAGALEKADTDALVRAVFVDARAVMAKADEKTAARHALEATLKRMFREQKAQYLERARARLERKAVA